MMIDNRGVTISIILITLSFTLFACQGGGSYLRYGMSKSALITASHLFHADGTRKRTNEISPNLISELNIKYNETMEDLCELHKLNFDTISLLFKRPMEKNIKSNVSIVMDAQSYVNVDSMGDVSISLAAIQSSVSSAMWYSTRPKNFNENTNIMLRYLNLNGFKPPIAKDAAIKSLSLLGKYVESLPSEENYPNSKEITIEQLWTGVVLPVGICFSGQRIFMLAHELGHIALAHHKWPQNCQTLKYMEIEADTYAAILVSMHLADFVTKLESFSNPDERFQFGYQINELVNIFSMLGHEVFFNLTYEIMGFSKHGASETCGYPSAKMRADHIEDVVTLFFSPRRSDIHLSLNRAYSEIHEKECKKGN